MRIYPAEMNLIFNFDDHSCYEKLTGRCSLEVDDLPEPETSGFKTHYMRKQSCQDFYNAIKDNPATGNSSETIRITKYKCGHHLISGGQHRICIAKRKGLPLEIEPIEPAPYDCRFCTKKD